MSDMESAELATLNDTEALILIRRSLDEGFILDRFAGSVPIFRRAATLGSAPGAETLRTAWAEHFEALVPKPGRRVLWHRCGPDCLTDILARAAALHPEPEGSAQG